MRATLAHAWSGRSANTNLRDASSGVARIARLMRQRRPSRRGRGLLPTPHLDHVTDGYVDTVRIPIQGTQADEVLNERRSQRQFGRQERHTSVLLATQGR